MRKTDGGTRAIGSVASMEPIKHYECTTAEEVLNTLRRTVGKPDHGRPSPDRWIWRGQVDAAWELVPSAFRPGMILGYMAQQVRVTGRALASYMQWRAEYNAIYEFLRLADSLGLHVAGDSQVFRHPDAFVEAINKSDWRADWPPHEVLEVMALAQHYGVPTRLLDFSFRYGVAAYFAAAPDVNRGPFFAVWGIDLNFLDAVRQSSGLNWLTAVTVPRAANRNLHAQHGLFLIDRAIANRDVSPQINRAVAVLASVAWQEGYVDQSWIPMVRVTAPSAVAQELLNLLSLEGYDEPHLMPSFECVVRSLRAQQQERAAISQPVEVIDDHD